MSFLPRVALLVALPLALFAGLFAAAVPALAAEEVHQDTRRYLLGEATAVHVNLGFGEIRVEGSDGNEIEIDYRLTCSREDLEKCRRRAERVRVVPRIRGQRFVIGLKHTPRGRIQGIQAHLVVKMPRGVPLDVDLTSGDVFVTRMQGDVVVAGGNGDVDIIAEHQKTGEVDASVVAGKAELWLGDGYLEGSGFPRSLAWNGPGTARIKVRLGTGDARIKLE